LSSAWRSIVATLAIGARGAAGTRATDGAHVVDGSQVTVGVHECAADGCRRPP
jgi:hypothetical protein